MRDGEYKQAVAWMDHPGKPPDKQTDLFALPAFKYDFAYGGLILQSVQEAIDTYRRVGVFEYTYTSPKLQEYAWHPLRANLGAMMKERTVIRIV